MDLFLCHISPVTSCKHLHVNAERGDGEGAAFLRSDGGFVYFANLIPLAVDGLNGGLGCFVGIVDPVRPQVVLLGPFDVAGLPLGDIVGVEFVGDDDGFTIIGGVVGGEGLDKDVVTLLLCRALRLVPCVVEEVVEDAAAGLLLLPLLGLLVLLGDLHRDGVAFDFLAIYVAGYPRDGLHTGFGGFEGIGESAGEGAGLLAVDEADGL